MINKRIGKIKKEKNKKVMKKEIKKEKMIEFNN